MPTELSSIARDTSSRRAEGQRETGVTVFLCEGWDSLEKWIVGKLILTTAILTIEPCCEERFTLGVLKPEL